MSGCRRRCWGYFAGLGSVALISALLLVAVPVAHAGDVTGSASGFAEIRGIGYVGVDGKPWQLVERFRPTFNAHFSDHVALVTTLEVGLAEGRSLQTEFENNIESSAFFDDLQIGQVTTTPWDAAGCSWPAEPDNELFQINDLADYARIDRLYADFHQDKTDVRVGRQAVEWGNALLIHPADPFPEVLFLEPWKPRSGVNAAKLAYQLGDSSSATVLAGTDDSLQYGRFAGKLTINALKTDFSAIGAWRQDAETGIAGVDIKGTAKVGFWFEGSWHYFTNGTAPVATDGTVTNGYEEIATGIDYSFPVLQQFVISAQYYRNGGGSDDISASALTGRLSGALVPPTCTDPDAGSLFTSSATVDPFAPFFTGVNYGMLATQLVVDDRWSGNAAAIQNFGDGTGIVVPTVSYKPFGWSEWSLSAQLPYKAWGHGGELDPGPSQTNIILKTADSPFIPLDFSGLVPKATIILWTRASF